MFWVLPSCSPHQQTNLQTWLSIALLTLLTFDAGVCFCCQSCLKLFDNFGHKFVAALLAVCVCVVETFPIDLCLLIRLAVFVFIISFIWYILFLCLSLSVILCLSLQIGHHNFPTAHRCTAWLSHMEQSANLVCRIQAARWKDCGRSYECGVHRGKYRKTIEAFADFLRACSKFT